MNVQSRQFGRGRTRSGLEAACGAGRQGKHLPAPRPTPEVGTARAGARGGPKSPSRPGHGRVARGHRDQRRSHQWQCWETVPGRGAGSDEDSGDREEGKFHLRQPVKGCRANGVVILVEERNAEKEESFGCERRGIFYPFKLFMKIVYAHSLKIK